VPFTYAFEPENDLVSITASGRITTEEALATFDAIVSHPEFQEGIKVLSDHRGLETVVTPGFVRAFIGRIERRGELFRGTRCALVESGSARYGMARMASVLSEMTPINMRAFRDLDEARTWVLAPD
jgi:hypothetical protein